MNRLAIISDIHANFHALKAVLLDERFRKCERALFCGDAVGYYYQPDEVVEYLRSQNTTSIAGNHDRELLANIREGRWPTDGYMSKYGSGLTLAQRQLSPLNLKWLASLPETFECVINSVSVKLCHGSPWDRDEYIYPDCPDDKKKRMFDLGYDVIILGHSHYQFVFKKGRQLIVNPGSVGQPRDGSGYAAWAVLQVNSKSAEAELMRIRYDVTPVVREAELRDPNMPYLSEVITEVLMRKR